MYTRRSVRIFALVAALAVCLPLAVAQNNQQVQITEGPNVQVVDQNTAIVRWKTNVPSSSVVMYGTDRFNRTQRAESQYSNDGSHEVRLNGLQPGQQYFVSVYSGGAQGSGASIGSDVVAFKAGDLGSAQAANQQSNRVQITEGPRVEVVNESTAVVRWKTNVPSSSVVMYGTDPYNRTQRAESQYSNTGDHEVRLTGLRPGEEYYVSVYSGGAQGSGASIGSDVVAFKAGQPGSTQASEQQNQGQQAGGMRVLAGPIVQNAKDTSATLWWMVDRAGDRSNNLTFHYGTDRNNMQQTAQVRAEQRQSSVELNNLQPGQTYYYELRANNNDVRHRGQFETLQANYDKNAMRITNGPVIEYLDNDAAIVAWSTTRPSSTLVRYGTDPNSLNQTATAPWGPGTHRVRIGNLKPNTTYYFVVESSQAKGQGAIAKSQPGQFVTLNTGEAAFKNPQPRIGNVNDNR